ncbi:MAG: M4 family metallopeptidase, partial [Bacteroidia bacterium]|nr:M4 family metallopeptidase [Bacteroidia bacterium]
MLHNLTRLTTYKYFILLGFVLLTIPVFSQVSSNVTQLRYEQNSGTRFHFEIPRNQLISEQQTPAFLIQLFKLSRNESFKISKELVLGESEHHVRYRHYSNGNNVLASEVVAHYFNGRLSSINGILYTQNTGNASIDIETARDLAIKYSGGEVFNWQHEQEEQMYKLWKEDSLATYYPKGELVYAPKDFDFNSPFELCYVFEINAIEPLTRKNIYVNARSGELWAEENLLHIVDVQGSANTKYRGVKPIVTDSVSPGNYRLRESGRGGGIETYNMLKGTNYGAAVDFTDADNYWNNYNANFDEIAGDAHYGAEMTYDYFYNKFNRNSFDDNGAKIRSYVHYRNNYSNAFWNGSVMTYGDGNGTSVTPLTSIDVCGHEIAHAVTTNSAGLIYRYESGALNESFSDIFGNAIEYYADSTQFNWRVGEDILVSGNGIRNMANPNTHGDPDTYLGTSWYAGTGDNGGVHTNSGVQNFWFYLLTEGGNGTNDNSDVYSVDSLGIAKAEAIAYRNLTVYLTRSSDYAEARYYAIQSAADLFGQCSDEVIATTNAWYACGVGDEYDSSFVQALFIADTMYCDASETVNFLNRSINAKSYDWDFGDGNSSQDLNPTHNYSGQGSYSVELIVEGCFNGIFDTLLKTNYIEIDSTRDICDGYLMTRGQWDTIYDCKGFVYDHGGEDIYSNLSRDTITINFGLSDSAHITFEEFNYENNWDSIYIYDGANTSGTLIGGFTGNALPNGGNPITLNSGSVTITHFSDNYVVESGFKASFEAFRPPVQLSTSPDTLVCYNQSINLSAFGSGGNRADYAYYWNGIKGDSSFSLTAVNDTIIYILFGDDCLESYLYDSIVVSVRDSLKLDPISDSTLCYLEQISLVASATGGDPANYTYTWLPTGTNTNPWDTQFSADETIEVTIEDGCTQQSDTISFEIIVRDPISFSQSNDTTICQGTSTDLILNGSGGLGNFWFTSSQGSTGGPSSNFTETVSPIGSGNHNFWIALTDQCSETMDTAFYTVTMRDSLELQVSNDTSICYGTSVDLTAFASGGVNTDYQYDWGSGFTSNATSTVNPLVNTTYTATLKDGCSVYEPSGSVTVTVLDSLKVTITGPDTACFGEQVQFDALVSGGDASAYTYIWNSGAGSNSSFQTTITSDNLITLILSDGCTPKNAADVHPIIARDPLVLTMPNDTSICDGSSILLTPLVNGGIESSHVLTWDNGLGIGPFKVVTPSVATTYSVTLSDNCSEPINENVTISLNPLPNVQFTIDPNPSCTGLDISFSNETPIGGLGQFEWAFGDGLKSSTEDAIHSYSNAGTYDITLHVTDELGCVDSLTKLSELSIEEHPVASFTHTPDIANYFNPLFSFTNTSTNASIYNWTFGDGGTSSLENPTYTYGDTGRYLVSLLASNSIGCSDELFIDYVVVEDVFILYVPNAFSPNGDGTNDEYGIESRGILTYEMVIFNRWGEILWQTTNPNDTW